MSIDREIAELKESIAISDMEKQIAAVPAFKGADAHAIAKGMQGCADPQGLMFERLVRIQTAKARAAAQSRSSNGVSRAAAKEPTLDEFRRMRFPELSRLQKERPDTYQRLLEAERGW